MKILLGNLLDKEEYVICMRNLKQALNHGLVFKKVRKIIKSNKKFQLKPYIDMDADLRKKIKKLFWKIFF